MSNFRRTSASSWLSSVEQANTHRVHIGLLLIVAALHTGCATSVSAIHDPLYRASLHNSTITANARNTSVGIERIDIVVITGEMTDCTELGGPPRIIPCRQNASTITHTCNYAGNPSNATCTFTQSLGNESIVTYEATAIPASGSSRSTNEITYSGGFPPTAIIARPVWWQRNQARAAKLDLGFFPDADYSGLYTSFTNDMQTIALGSFFNSGQPFSSVYTLFRNSFNLWAAPFGADANGCSRSFSTAVSPIVAEMDGQAIVHSDFFRDCASISLGGSGSVWANAGDADYILVHESGHFLHGQGDEYDGGGNASAGSCNNVFSTESACQATAPGAGAQASDCVEIGTTGKWRIDDGNLETMKDRSDNANFRNNSSQCVIQRFTNCSSGTCY